MQHRSARALEIGIAQILDTLPVVNGAMNHCAELERRQVHIIKYRPKAESELELIELQKSRMLMSPSKLMPMPSLVNE